MKTMKFDMWFITLSGVATLLLIALLSKYDPILGSCVGVIFFFLMMFSLFVARFTGKMLNRKDNNDD